MRWTLGMRQTAAKFAACHQRIGRLAAAALLLGLAAGHAVAEPIIASAPAATPSGSPASRPSHPAPPLPSASPGHYDYTGMTSVKFNGKVMTPTAALNALSRNDAETLRQIQPERDPLGKTVRIVLPDHDRLRPLVGQRLKQPTSGTLDFVAEFDRLELHINADAVVRSQLFSRATIVEQNDVVAPDPAGADYLIWFQIRSVSPNNAGPWTGRWLMKQAGGTVAAALGTDPGTPTGVPRMESFVKSVRLAATQLGNAIPAAHADGPRHVASSGSGIVLDADGHVLTNNHVIASCPDLHVIDASGDSGGASVIAADATNDLALVKTARHWSAWASFRDSHALRPGESLVVTGYPLNGLVSTEMAVTTGSLTALAGLRGDTRQFEFSAPVQPGNSGGPVLDDTGHVVGVTVAMLNGMAVAAATGALPQNANFAIKSTTAREFLDAHQIAVDEGGGQSVMDAAAVAALARTFTVRIECWR